MGDHSTVEVADAFAAGTRAEKRENAMNNTGETAGEHGPAEAERGAHMFEVALTYGTWMQCERSEQMSHRGYSVTLWPVTG